VAFEILPAIDVAGGRLVSVSDGEVRELRAFGGSPVAAAEAFVAAGAGWLHVVDVDRANGGTPDVDMLRRLARAGANIQASGGIASRSDAEAVLQAGAHRVVLSSSILADRDGAAALIEALAGRAVVGIEADGVRIRPRGASSMELSLAGTLEWLRPLGAARYLYTAVSRVATLAGPDLDAVRASSRALDRPVLVAGGVRTVDDVRTIRALGPDAVEGCVVGRALYDGLDLAELRAAVL
jgi:phosphoribosylformimino-5-aminoimidazole carboxamide ribonucleotide (ProFAR) isomerase